MHNVECKSKIPKSRLTFALYILHFSFCIPSTPQKSPQHGLQYPAVAVVFQLDRRVDADGDGELDHLAARGAPGSSTGPPASSGPPAARMSNVSSPDSPSDCHVLPAGSSRGSTPMPTRLLRWIRSKPAASTARTPSRYVPLAAQSRLLPAPYSVPAKTTSGAPSSLIKHRGVVDRHQLAVGQVPRHAPFRARRQQVPQADVGERPAGHHPVVAAAGAVAVELRPAPRRAR